MILLVGGNPAETLPPMMQYFEEQQRRGGRLIVVDPRRTATARSGDACICQITPGTDAALANGLLHVAIREGLIDHAFIADAHDRLRGGPARRRLLLARPGRAHHRRAGRRDRAGRAAAGRGRHGDVLTGRGPEQQSNGVDNVLAFINLALALGKVGPPAFAAAAP